MRNCNFRRHLNAIPTTLERRRHLKEQIVETDAVIHKADIKCALSPFVRRCHARETAMGRMVILSFHPCCETAVEGVEAVGVGRIEVRQEALADRSQISLVFSFEHP